MTAPRWLANALLFQVCWLVSVAGAGRGYAWIGFVPLALFAAWQLRASAVPRADVKLMALAAVLGFAVDTSLVQSGALHFATPVPSAELAPAWIIGIWAAFALTLNHSLAFLQRSPIAAVALGLVGGPIAYGVAASRFDAVVFDGTALFGVALIGLAWAALTPALVRLATWLAAHEPAPRHA